MIRCYPNHFRDAILFWISLIKVKLAGVEEGHGCGSEGWEPDSVEVAHEQVGELGVVVETGVLYMGGRFS